MHEKCVICTILHAWYFARCHLSMCVCVYPGYFSPNQALICRANWPEFHMPQGDIVESIKCPSDVMQRRNRVQILHFRFWLLLHFHLDFIVDIILQHAEGVIWPLCLWNPFKANCSLFSKNLLASLGKWESVFSFSSAAKTIHLDKSFSVVLSLISPKVREIKICQMGEVIVTKANWLV